MSKIKKGLLFLIILLGFSGGIANADEVLNINLTIRDGSNIIFENTVPLRPAGDIDLNGHTLNADSVLSVLNDADLLSDNFSITDLQYYESYGSFYLKCINNKCDNWQFTVNGNYSSSGMDKNILSGGENVYIYFGPQNKIVLSASNINTDENLVVTTQKYNYLNDSWANRTGVTIGITQPNPNDIWTPNEIETKIVDADGKAVFSNIPVGLYNIGVKDDFYFPTEPLTVIEPPAITTGGSSGGNSYTPLPKKSFDIKKAFEFILSKQKENGSFGGDLYTDWVAIALGTTEDYSEQKNKLLKYYSELEPKEYQLTDYERHSMALMSLGLNPYNTNNENYIKKILTNFDGTQFGDISQNNDDIFALIVLSNAGFTEKDEVIIKTTEFLISKQNENGSWNNSIDITSAGIVALSVYKDNKITEESIEKAKKYLKEKQNENGGWENISSTSWAIGGIVGLNDEPKNWKINDNSPLDFLVLNQEIDGSVKNASTQNENTESKLWETSYAITASSLKTWTQIMQKFEKIDDNIKDENIKEKTEENKEIFKKPIKLKKISIEKEIISKSIEIEKQEPLKNSTNKKRWLLIILSKIFNL